MRLIIYVFSGYESGIKIDPSMDVLKFYKSKSNDG